MGEKEQAGSQGTPVTGEMPSGAEGGTPPVGEQPVKAAPDLQAQIVSYQAQLEAEKQAKQTLEEKLRSTQANLHQRFDLQAELAAIRRSETRRDAMLQLLVEAQQDGGEGLPAKLAALRQQQQQEETLDATQQEAMELRNDLVAEAETAGLDPAVAPELKEVRETWQAGVDSRDIKLLRKARNQAVSVRREAQAKALEKARQEAKQAGRREAEAEMKGTLTKAGVYDTASSRQASSPGAISDADFLQRYVVEPGKYNSPADHKRAEKILAGM